MKNSISKVERQLVKVEQKLAERARRKLLETCECAKFTSLESLKPEELEDQMNLPCPAHEFRSLGSLVIVGCEPEGPEQEATVARFEQLLAEYERRSHRLVSSGLEL
jgi:hypothetical protein